MSENKVKKNKEYDNPMQALEEGLIFCHFGVFHVRLLIASLAAYFSGMIVSTTVSYILPNAECDLNMNTMRKGLLSASPFIGQGAATLFTGFLVDVFGRRLFLIGGNAGIFIFSILEGCSQNFCTLFYLKVFEGIFVSMTYCTITSMIAEFTHKGVRDRVMMFSCSFMPMSLIVSALISWLILPNQDWHFVIWKGYFGSIMIHPCNAIFYGFKKLHAWNIYLYVCSVFSLIATVLYCTIPESPKYLLSHGQQFEALEVLKTIYSQNTGKDKNTFPIKSLTTSGTFKEATNKIGIKKQLSNALFEVKELFRKPLVSQLTLFMFLSSVCLVVYSALRIWYPQLITIVENYQVEHNGTARFCTMFSHYTEDLKINLTDVKNATVAEICVPKFSGSETYINNIILGCFCVFSINISAYLVSYMSQKLLMFILLILCASCSGALYWTSSSLQIALLLSASCSLMNAALSLQQNIIVRIFPTTVRSLALSIIVMLGRISALLGNIAFPVLLEIGCMAPFLAMSLITLAVAGLVYFVPNPNVTNSETGDK